MKNQNWYCEVCNQSGFVEYEGVESVWFRVMGKIQDAHKAVSPDCPGNAIRSRKTGKKNYSLVDNQGIAIIVKAG